MLGTLRSIGKIVRTSDSPFNVVFVDSFDHSVGICGGYKTPELALSEAKKLNDLEVDYSDKGSGISTEYYACDREGNIIN